MPKEILARRPYSHLEGDSHLEVVMAKIDNKITPYVTWCYNKQTNGYFWGHYFITKNAAIDDFYFRNQGD